MLYAEELRVEKIRMQEECGSITHSTLDKNFWALE